MGGEAVFQVLRVESGCTCIFWLLTDSMKAWMVCCRIWGLDRPIELIQHFLLYYLPLWQDMAAFPPFPFPSLQSVLTDDACQGGDLGLGLPKMTPLRGLEGLPEPPSQCSFSGAMTSSPALHLGKAARIEHLRYFTSTTDAAKYSFSFVLALGLYLTKLERKAANEALMMLASVG